MEELHNHLATTIAHHLQNEKVTIAEAILALEMLRHDLVSQVNAGAYTKKPVTLAMVQGMRN